MEHNTQKVLLTGTNVDYPTSDIKVRKVMKFKMADRGWKHITRGGGSWFALKSRTETSRGPVDAVGCFVNTHPLNSDWRGGRRFSFFEQAGEDRG